MNRLVTTSVILAMALSLPLSLAHAFSTESYSAGGHTKNTAGVTDPDEASPLQAKPDGAPGSSGTTYNFQGSGFSLHFSGPQQDQSPTQLWFKPAGQDALGLHSNRSPRSIFPGQP